MMNFAIGMLIDNEDGKLYLEKFKIRDNEEFDLKINYYEQQKNDDTDKIANINIIPKNNVYDVVNSSGIIIVDYKEEKLINFLENNQDILQDKLVVFTEKINPDIINEYITIYMNLILVRDENEKPLSLLLVRNDVLSEEIWSILLEEVLKIFKDFNNIELVYFEEVDEFIKILKKSRIYLLKVLTLMGAQYKMRGFDEVVINKLLVDSASSLIEDLKNEYILYLEKELDNALKKSDIKDKDLEELTKVDFNHLLDN